MPRITFFRAAAIFAISHVVQAANVNSTSLPPGASHSCCRPSAIGTGPLEKPWNIDGIGIAPFPITTSNPEVQKWFDQGITLLDCFWDNEAERAFRWCLKLDPDCAMAYWGLARAVSDSRDVTPEINEAVKRKAKVSARERSYIEAWAAFYRPDKSGSAGNTAKLSRRMEAICADYPDDVEAQVIVGLLNLTDADREKNERHLQQALARNPESVGAHHFRVHTWDHADSAARVLDSVEALKRLAPASPHIQHMPGHIYCKLGCWSDAAAAMETAERVEVRYLHQHLLMPFDDWNYAHNRNYLSYVQEQLGMAEAAMAGANELLAAPQDPEENDPEKAGSIFAQGRVSLVRVLVKFERWKEILDGTTIPWGHAPADEAWKSYCDARAWIGIGNLPKAEKAYAIHRQLRSRIQKLNDPLLAEIQAIQSLELRGRIELAHDEVSNGFRHLGEAAQRESEFRRKNNDPPIYPTCLFNSLGEARLARNDPAQAVIAFGKALEVLPNDGFALSGLVQGLWELKRDEEARDAFTRLLNVWSGADPALPWLARAKSLGIDAKAGGSLGSAQDRDAQARLDDPEMGTWRPNAAPVLDATDAEGKRVTLEDYAGKNVLLIFCDRGDRKSVLAELKRLEVARARLTQSATDMVLILNSAPESVSALAEAAELRRARPLFDSNFENARRFKAYDDFADAPVNAALLIDPQGRIRWSHHGGKPFDDFQFLLNEIKRLGLSPGSE